MAAAQVTVGMPFLEPVWPYVDPATDYTPVSKNVVYSTYDRLVELSAADAGGFQFTPGLAEYWDVSADGLSYHFRIDPRARFASGRSVTAQDAVFSFRRLMAMAKPPSHLLRLSVVRAVSSSVLEVVLDKPSGAGLAAIASPAFSVIDRDSVRLGDDLGQSWLTSHSAGSGPFTLTSVTDTEVILDASLRYWREPPFLNRVILVDSPGNQPAAVLRDTGPDIMLTASPALFAACSRDPAFAVEQVGSLFCPNITLLKDTRGPDGRSLPEIPTFVEAVKYAIDYDAVAGLFGGWGGGVYPAQSAFVPGVCGYSPGLAYHYHYDPRRAGNLVAAAGYRGGIDIELPYFTGSWGGIDTADIAGVLSRSLATAGIRSHPRAYGGADFYAQLLDQRSMTGLSLSLSFYGVLDPEDVFRRKLTFYNLTGYQLDAENALSEAAAARGRASRAARYRELQLRFLAEMPMIYLLCYPHRVVRRAEITGYRQPPHAPGPDLSALNVSGQSRRA